MKKLKNAILKMANRVEVSGYSPKEFEIFNSNLKYLLDMNNVRGYNIAVYKNQFVGVLYHWIDGLTNVAHKIPYKRIEP